MLLSSVLSRHILASAVLLCLLIPLGTMAQPSMAELEDRVGEILQQGCAMAGCHAGPVPQMNLDLRADRFVMATLNHPSLGRPDLNLVEPGDPDRSYLLMKMENAEGIIGMQMPLEGSLPEAEVAAVREWIERLGEEDVTARQEPPAERFAFLGWQAVNLPTNRGVSRGGLLTTIGHRFNPRVTSGYDTFFGLDGSSVIFLNLRLGLTDRLSVGLGRSNAEGNVQLEGEYIFQFEEEGAAPFSVGSRVALNFLTDRPPGGGPRLRSEAIRLSGQVAITRAFGDRGGIAFVPGVLINPTMEEELEPHLITMGMAGRVRLHGNMSLVGEWVHILDGYTPTRTFGNLNRFDSFSGAFEIATAGHVFQIVASNSVGVTTDQYMRGGDLPVDIRRPTFRLGFNIFRTFNVY